MKKILIALSTLFLAGCTTSEATVKLPEDYREANSPYSNTVSCELTITGSVGLTPFEEQFDAKGSVGENPLSVTITDINTDSPVLTTNDGYRVDLLKPNTIGTETTLYMFEVTGTGNLNVWTLFREKNILSLTKQYDLLGTPFAYAMMGTCKSGIN